jgi:hypothetical protein
MAEISQTFGWLLELHELITSIDVDMVVLAPKYVRSGMPPVPRKKS